MAHISHVFLVYILLPHYLYIWEPALNFIARGCVYEITWNRAVIYRFDLTPTHSMNMDLRLGHFSSIVIRAFSINNLWLSLTSLKDNLILGLLADYFFLSWQLFLT